MAGGILKPGSKQFFTSNNQNPVETLQQKSPAPSEYNLAALLNSLLNKKEDNPPAPERPPQYNPEYSLIKQNTVLFDQRARERQELLQQLITKAKNIRIPEAETPIEISSSLINTPYTAKDYEINYYENLIQTIQLLAQNSQAHESSLWHQTQKRKRNCFWNNTKKGGGQYLASGEHSASRSAT